MLRRGRCSLVLVLVLAGVSTCAKDEEATLDSACADRCDSCGLDAMDCQIGCDNEAILIKALGQKCIDATIALWECEADAECASGACTDEQRAESEACVVE